VLEQLGQLVEITVREPLKVLGVDADAGVDMGIGFGISDRGMRGLKINGGVDNGSHAVFGHRG
jgi:hypothetical protein